MFVFLAFFVLVQSRTGIKHAEISAVLGQEGEGGIHDLPERGMESLYKIYIYLYNIYISI